MKRIQDASHPPSRTPVHPEAEKTQHSDSTARDASSLEGSSSPSVSHRGRSVAPVEGSTAFEKPLGDSNPKKDKKISRRKASKTSEKRPDKRPGKEKKIKKTVPSKEVLKGYESSNESSSFQRVSEGNQEDSVKPEVNKVANETYHGFFHLKHPGQGFEMSRSDLLAHLEMVEHIESVLFDILESSSKKPNMHSLSPEIISVIMNGIEAFVNQWIELPPKPEDAAIHPREALKKLLDQYKTQSGYPQKTDEEQMNAFLAQCRKLFPVDESGSLNKADTHDNQKPVPTFVGRVSEKIKDILKNQTE